MEAMSNICMEKTDFHTIHISRMLYLIQGEIREKHNMIKERRLSCRRDKRLFVCARESAIQISRTIRNQRRF